MLSLIRDKLVVNKCARYDMIAGGDRTQLAIIYERIGAFHRAGYAEHATVFYCDLTIIENTAHRIFQLCYSTYGHSTGSTVGNISNPRIVDVHIPIIKCKRARVKYCYVCDIIDIDLPLRKEGSRILNTIDACLPDIDYFSRTSFPTASIYDCIFGDARGKVECTASVMISSIVKGCIYYARYIYNPTIGECSIVDHTHIGSVGDGQCARVLYHTIIF